MKTTYLVWKDPACNGINPEWREITRDEFLALVKSPESNDRRFVRLGSTDTDGGDGRYVMEATESEYKDWLTEKRRRQYIRNFNRGYTMESYHAMDDDDGCYGDEVFGSSDGCFDAIETSILVEQLKGAMQSLSSSESAFLDLLVKSGMNQSDVAKQIGITQQAASRRESRVLAKLRMKIT
jgi:RNA polymerase sigma factor (sigma-70 family)